MKRYLLVLLLLLLASPAYAATYTVCPSECDYTTIQGCENGVARGDTCLVSAGTYAERVTVNTAVSGTDTITFTASGTVTMLGFLIQTDYIIVDGFNVNNTTDCDGYTTWITVRRDCNGIQVEGDYVQILNNTITDTEYNGISLLGLTYTDPSYCTISGNTILESGQMAIVTAGDNHTISNNDISGTVQWHGFDEAECIANDNPVDCCTGEGAGDCLDASDSDGIRFYGSDQIFRGNYIHDIVQTGDNSDSHIDCFQTGQGNTDSILFERNICYNECATLGQGAMIGAAAGVTVSNLTFQYNVFRMTGEDRPCLNTDRTLGVGTIQNITFNNNVCATLVSESQLGVNIDQVAGAEVKNNIFYNFGDATHGYVFDQQLNTLLDIGYNLVYKGNAVEPDGGAYMDVTNCTAADTPYDCCTGEGEGATCAETDIWMDDPEFINFALSNFHLQSTSPAIDAGTDLGLTTDCAGNTVPSGSAPDIGAYEYYGESIRGCTLTGVTTQ